MTRVLLLTNNPRWQGTEAQVASLADAFRDSRDVVMHAAVFLSLARMREETGKVYRAALAMWNGP